MGATACPCPIKLPPSHIIHPEESRRSVFPVHWAVSPFNLLYPFISRYTFIFKVIDPHSPSSQPNEDEAAVEWMGSGYAFITNPICKPIYPTENTPQFYGRCKLLRCVYGLILSVKVLETAQKEYSGIGYDHWTQEEPKHIRRINFKPSQSSPFDIHDNES